MKMEIRELLERSAQEIEHLRHTNEIQSARLDMFDSVMNLFWANPGRNMQGGMHPDILLELKQELDKPPINEDKPSGG